LIALAIASHPKPGVAWRSCCVPACSSPVGALGYVMPERPAKTPADDRGMPVVSDRIARVESVGVRFARSATKHRVSKDSIRYVIAQCGLRFKESAPGGDAEVQDLRLVYLGDDAEGHQLEIIAVELSEGDLLVIHAMALRNKYQAQYEEAKRWRL
jgi:hypothetical protein